MWANLEVVGSSGRSMGMRMEEGYVNPLVTLGGGDAMQIFTQVCPLVNLRK